MKLCLHWDGHRFHPASEDDVDECAKLQVGEYIVDAKKERNPQFHKLAFALINDMFRNQERFENFEDFRRELKILTGHYDEYIRPDGKVVYVPKSWEFARCDDVEFHEIFNKLLSIAAKRFGDDFVQRYA